MPTKPAAAAPKRPGTGAKLGAAASKPTAGDAPKSSASAHKRRVTKYAALGGRDDNPMAFVIALAVAAKMDAGATLEIAAEEVAHMMFNASRYMQREWRAGTYPGMEKLPPDILDATLRVCRDGPNYLRMISASRATKHYAYWFGKGGRMRGPNPTRPDWPPEIWEVILK